MYVIDNDWLILNSVFGLGSTAPRKIRKLGAF